MDTLTAIRTIAAAQAADMDPSKLPVGAHLRRQTPSADQVAIHAVEILGGPAINGASQVRLASAMDRLFTGAQQRREQHSAPAEKGFLGKVLENTSKIARSIDYKVSSIIDGGAQKQRDTLISEVLTALINDADGIGDVAKDVALQGAAASYLRTRGEQDPLSHLDDRSRGNQGAETLTFYLDHYYVPYEEILQAAPTEDLKAIAAGRFDLVTDEATRRDLVISLKQSDAQISTPTAETPAKIDALPDISSYPLTGIGKGPATVPVDQAWIQTQGAER